MISMHFQRLTSLFALPLILVSGCAHKVHTLPPIQALSITVDSSIDATRPYETLGHATVGASENDVLTVPTVDPEVAKAETEYMEAAAQIDELAEAPMAVFEQTEIKQVQKDLAAADAETDDSKLVDDIRKVATDWDSLLALDQTLKLQNII